MRGWREVWLRRVRTAVAPGLMLLAGVLTAPTLRAQVTQVPGTLTNLRSNENRMISYRNQSHMWRTADGYTHLVMNVTSTLGGLVEWTSLDGQQWTAGPALPSSGLTSTSDVDNEGDDAYIVYSGMLSDSGVTSDVRFAQLHYDSSQHAWSLVKSEVVFAASGTLASTPAMIVDKAGRRWVTVSVYDGSTYAIKLFVKESDSASWQDTGQVFAQDNQPAPTSATPDRSARPVITRTGVGLIFTLHKKTYWTQRVNRWPLDHAWTRPRLVYEKQGDDTDPYGTHYSAVVDSKYNIHLVSVDNHRLVYSRMLNATQAWVTKTVQSGSDQDPATAYVQAVMLGGKLVVVANAGTNLEVYVSSNLGNSFVRTQELTHDAVASPDGNDPDYTRPRVEVASNPVSPLMVLQQVQQKVASPPDEDSNVLNPQWALSFSVPVSGAGASN